jgi:hypothetical protein
MQNHPSLSEETFSLGRMLSTPVPNRLLEETARLPATPARVLLVVVRMTLGWHAGSRSERRASATISYRDILRATGLRSPVAVSSAVDYLVKAGIVETMAEDGTALDTGADRRRNRAALRFRIARRFVEERCGQACGKP